MNIQPTTSYGIGNQRKNTAKKVLTATAAIATGVVTTLYLARKGKLNPVDGGNKTIEAIKAALKGPADKILNTITGTKVFANVAEKVGKVKTEIDPIFELASKKAGEIKENFLADAETVLANAEGKVKGFAQKVPSYTQEARCKLSGFAGELNDATQKTNKAISKLAEKEPVKKAIAFAKDIPTYIGCFVLDAQDKIAKFFPKAQQEAGEEIQKGKVISDLANALRQVAEKAQ